MTITVWMLLPGCTIYQVQQITHTNRERSILLCTVRIVFGAKVHLLATCAVKVNE